MALAITSPNSKSIKPPLNINRRVILKICHNLLMLMSKTEVLKQIENEVRKNPYSYQHNVNVWLNFLSNYPKNKLFTTTLIQNDYFPKVIRKEKHSSKMLNPVLSALAISPYFLDICFPKKNFSKTHLINVAVAFFDFYYLAMRKLPTEELLKFHNYFVSTFRLTTRVFEEHIDWEIELRKELKEKVKNIQLIRNILAIYFGEIFLEKTHPYTKEKIVKIHAIDYFRTVSLGVFPDLAELRKRVENDTLSLTKETNWKDSLIDFKKSNKLNGYLIGHFKSKEGIKNLSDHLNQLTSDDSFMLLLMYR
jgi:hypothetical protein